MDGALFKELLTLKNDGVIIPCWIQPHSSRNSIVGIHGDALKVSLTAPPVDGKANSELCKFIAKKLSISKSSVQITAGHMNRRKTLFVSGISYEDVVKKVAT
jgi:uncharacterized protein